jgi:hypothetical protein
MDLRQAVPRCNKNPAFTGLASNVRIFTIAEPPDRLASAICYRRRQTMRSVVLTLVILALTAAPAAAQKAWADKLFKDGTTHDFGMVARGAQLLHRFPITNIYAVPLEITEIRASCGCVTITPSVKTLKPLEKAHLEVRMDTRRFDKPKTVTIYVSVGPEYVSTATLTVSAKIRTDIVFNPGDLNFEVVQRGQTPTRTLDVEYAGALDWQITELVKNAKAPVEAKLEPLYRKPGQVGYRITVKLKADAAIGPFKHEVLLKTNDPASKWLTVLVEGIVQGPLKITPERLSLGKIKVGETKTYKVIVRANKAFKIAKIEGQGEGVTAEAPDASATIQVVSVQCQPTEAGVLRKTLQIRTDLEEESVPLLVEGTVVP